MREIRVDRARLRRVQKQVLLRFRIGHRRQPETPRQDFCFHAHQQQSPTSAVEQLSTDAAAGHALLSCDESYRVNPIIGTALVMTVSDGDSGGSLA